MFQTSISISEALSKVVMMLHRQPELMSGRRAAAGDEDSKSMVEQSADIIQKIFTSCLTDRSSTRFARPEGKKVGVYIFANLVLKLLFTVSSPIATCPGPHPITDMSPSQSAASLAWQPSCCSTYQQAGRLLNYIQQHSALPSSTTLAGSTLIATTLCAHHTASRRPICKHHQCSSSIESLSSPI